MLKRNRAQKYLKIRWDISFRKSFAAKSEDEQISELMSQCRHIGVVTEQCRQIQELVDSANQVQTWTGV